MNSIKNNSRIINDVITALKKEEDAFSNINLDVKSVVMQLDVANINHEIKSNFKKKILSLFVDNEFILISVEILFVLLEYIKELIKYDIIINNSFMELDYEVYLINFIKNFNKFTSEYKKNNPKRFYLSFDIKNNYLLFIFLSIIENYELLTITKEFKFDQKTNYLEISLKVSKKAKDSSEKKVFKYLMTSLDFKDKVSLVNTVKNNSVDYSTIFKKFYMDNTKLSHGAKYIPLKEDFNLVVPKTIEDKSHSESALQKFKTKAKKSLSDLQFVKKKDNLQIQNERSIEELLKDINSEEYSEVYRPGYKENETETETIYESSDRSERGGQREASSKGSSTQREAPRRPTRPAPPPPQQREQRESPRRPTPPPPQPPPQPPPGPNPSPSPSPGSDASDASDASYASEAKENDPSIIKRNLSRFSRFNSKLQDYLTDKFLKDSKGRDDYSILTAQDVVNINNDPNAFVVIEDELFKSMPILGYKPDKIQKQTFVEDHFSSGIEPVKIPVATIYKLSKTKKKSDYEIVDDFKYNNIVNVDDEEELKMLTPAKNCTFIVYIEKSKIPSIYLHFSKPENISTVTRYKLISDPDREYIIKRILNEDDLNSSKDYINSILTSLLKNNRIIKKMFFTMNVYNDAISQMVKYHSYYNKLELVVEPFDSKKFCVEKINVEFKHVNSLMDFFLKDLNLLKIFEAPFGVIIHINTNTTKLYYINNILYEDDLQTFHRIFFYNLSNYLFKVPEISVRYSFWNFNIRHKEIINRISILFGYKITYKNIIIKREITETHLDIQNDKTNLLNRKIKKIKSRSEVIDSEKLSV